MQFILLVPDTFMYEYTLKTMHLTDKNIEHLELKEKCYHIYNSTK
jgi:hypothetical protein